MAATRTEMKCGGKVTNNSINVAEDRISQLPDPLLHHIFSLLPSLYIVQMSVLSRRWRHMWLSTPYIYFDDCDDYTFRNIRKRDGFLKFVSNCLRCRKLQMQAIDTSLTSFKFDSTYFVDCEAKLIDDWLRFVLHSKVKELDFRVRYYSLPQFSLKSKSLTVLKLNRVKLDAPSPSSFPSLRVLSLMSVECNVKSLQNLISGCPSIEDLSWSRYANKNIDQGHVSVNTDSLKKVFIRVHRCPIDVTIRTSALECLRIECTVDSVISVEAPNLSEANLELVDLSMKNSKFISLIYILSNFGCLRKLTLTIGLDWVGLICFLGYVQIFKHF